MPRISELSALVTRYGRCMNQDDALSITAVAAAVENAWLAADIKEPICDEAECFGVSAPCTACRHNGLRAVRAFVAGDGWQ